jgi:hypothetical protein
VLRRLPSPWSVGSRSRRKAAVFGKLRPAAGAVAIKPRLPICGSIDSRRQPYLIIRKHAMSEQLTVADYVVRRLARERIADCFGVTGDFGFNGGCG